MSVPESIRELRGICQRSPQWNVPQPWAFLQIRRVSIYLTWLLLHTPITANGVSVVGMLLGILASWAFGTTRFAVGAAILFVAMVCDFADGEVSRYRKQQSKQGSYLDKLYHFTVQPSVFAGLTIGAYQVRPSVWVLVAGFISTIGVTALIMAMAYANELAIWRHSRKLIEQLTKALESEPSPALLTDLLRNNREADAPPPDPAQTAGSRFARWAATIPGLWDFPYIFFVVMTGAVAQELMPTASMRIAPLELVLLFYAVTYPCWIALYVFHVLASQSAERGFRGFARDLAVLLSKMPLSAVPDHRRTH